MSYEKVSGIQEWSHYIITYYLFQSSNSPQYKLVSKEEEKLVK